MALDDNDITTSTGGGEGVADGGSNPGLSGRPCAAML